MIGNFTEVKPLVYWVQHILPLVYDDSLSYMELLDKVIKVLNEVVKNNNLLPDYIMQLIKEYISSGEIEKVLAEVLANYMINVKFPPQGLKPAVGDGTEDDTEAIQGCIDYAFNNGGMSVYFPSGSYLTQPLTLRNKATLFGQDRYTTRLVMRGGATTAMFTGDVDELTLSGMGFDGNMDIQVNNVNLFTITVGSAIINNCLLTDGYDLLNVTINRDLQLNNIIFNHAVVNSMVVSGDGYIQGDDIIFKSVSQLIGENYIVLNTSNSALTKVKCEGASPNCVLITGNNNVIEMWNDNSPKAYTDNGTNNNIVVYGKSKQIHLTGNKVESIGGSLTQTVTGSATQAITGDKTVTANIIKETTIAEKLLTIGTNLTETITGNKGVTCKGDISTIANNMTETLTGEKTEIITGDKIVTGKTSTTTFNNSTENVLQVKTVKAGNLTETIQGDKTVTAGDISETSDNRTIHNKMDYDVTTDGNEVNTVTGNSTDNIKGAKAVSANTVTETVVGDKTTTATNVTNSISGRLFNSAATLANNAGVITNDATTLTTNVTGTETKTANAISETVATSKTVKSADLVIESTNPVTYRTPSNLNNMFKVVPMKGADGNTYNVLVQGDNIDDIMTSDNIPEINYDGINYNAGNYYAGKALIKKGDVPLPAGHTTQGSCLYNGSLYVVHHTADADFLNVTKYDYATLVQQATIQLEKNMHGNGLTVNPTTGDLIVTNNSGTFCIINAGLTAFKTVDYQGTTTGQISATAITPDGNNAVFSVTSTNNLIFGEMIDNVMTPFLIEHEYENGGSERQDICADNTFVYVLHTGIVQGAVYGSNYVNVLGKYGNQYGKIYFDKGIPELEGISVNGSTLVITDVRGGVWEVDVSPYVTTHWWADGMRGEIGELSFYPFKTITGNPLIQDVTLANGAVIQTVIPCPQNLISSYLPTFMVGSGLVGNSKASAYVTNTGGLRIVCSNPTLGNLQASYAYANKKWTITNLFFNNVNYHVTPDTVKSVIEAVTGYETYWMGTTGLYGFGNVYTLRGYMVTGIKLAYN